MKPGDLAQTIYGKLPETKGIKQQVMLWTRLGDDGRPTGLTNGLIKQEDIVLILTRVGGSVLVLSNFRVGWTWVSLLDQIC